MSESDFNWAVSRYSRKGILTEGRQYEVLNTRTTLAGGVTAVWLYADDGGLGWWDRTLFDLYKKPQPPATPPKPAPVHDEPFVTARAFWMVKGPGPTHFEHYDEGMAGKEAKRLALDSPGMTFTVLGPLRAYRKAELQVTDLRPYFESGENDAIPF